MSFVNSLFRHHYDIIGRNAGTAALNILRVGESQSGESEPDQEGVFFRRRNTERKMSEAAFTVFNELRLEGRLCDAVITINGVEFHVHKNILCGCSSFFRALFANGWSPSDKRVYTIHGLSTEIMRLIVEYAYTGSVTIDQENVQELLIAADYLCVTGLVHACCQFLEALLCVENCVGIWRFADTYSCSELEQKVFQFILQHFEEIGLRSEEFLDLPLEPLSKVIGMDELNVRREETVFEAILRWINHLPSERSGHITVLLPKVRTGLMTTEYFMNNVKNNSLVKDNKDCKPFVTSTMNVLFDLDIDELDQTDFKNSLTRTRLPYTILLAIGGWSGGSPTNGIEAYDTRADEWINVTSNVESPRAYHSATYLNGFVYCVGGFDGVDYFNSVRKFNPVSRSWHQVAPMHYRRCYVSVAVLNGCIYAMGGFDGHIRSNTAERYEPDSNQWTMIASMQEQRSDASATTLHSKVYICGGFNGNECLFTAECYDHESNQWTLIAPLRIRRSGVGVITYKEEVYAVGGFDGNNRLRSAEAYNPLTNTWRAVACMSSPRSNFGIEVIDDMLFVVGGFNGLSTSLNVECYDERADDWYRIRDMEISRSALSCCVVSGLPNISEYTAPRDDAQSLRQELPTCSSISI